MITIVTGSKTIADYNHVNFAIARSGFKDDITMVVTGNKKAHYIDGRVGAVDFLAESWAYVNEIPTEKFRSETYAKYGKAKEVVKNIHMVRFSGAEAIIAIHDGVCKDTEHLVRIAKNFGLKTFEFVLTSS